MQKMGSLTVDGLIAAIYETAQRESAVKRRGLPTKDAKKLRLAQAICIKIEPLSMSALQWMQGRGRMFLLESGVALSALREMSLLLTLDAGSAFAKVDGPCFEVDETFRADERREGRGEVDFLHLTVQLYTTSDLSVKYDDRLRKVAHATLEAARIYLQRDESQCSSCA